MNRTLNSALIAALPGLVFGFDTVIISGADKQLQQLFGTSEVIHVSLVMSMALWGTVIGAIFGSIPVNKIGRKATLLYISIVFLVASLGTLFSDGPYAFSFFRFLEGLAIGASTIAAPAYISEIAPSGKKGRYIGLYQLNIVCGILLAFIVTAVFDSANSGTWRWFFGLQLIPAVILITGMLRIPESPVWLLLTRKNTRAERALKAFRSQELTQQVHDEHLDSHSRYETIFMKKYRSSVVLTIFIAVFNQFSGINILLYYASDIFEKAGLESTSVTLKISIGLINLAFTGVGLFLIDRIGRKPLMLIGSCGYIAALGLGAIALHTGWNGDGIIFLLYLFIATHAIGQGLVIWVFIAEIFPSNVRPSGLALGGSVHWVLVAIIPSALPFVFSVTIPETVFLFFTFMMVMQLLFVLIVMPETKNQGHILTQQTNKNKKHDQLKKPSSLSA